MTPFLMAEPSMAPPVSYMVSPTSKFINCFPVKSSKVRPFLF